MGATDSKMPKTLKAVPSDLDSTPWPERIGRKTVELVKAGRWVSPLDGDVNNVAYQFDQYVEDIEAAVLVDPQVP